MEHYLEVEMIQQDATAVVEQLMRDNGQQILTMVYHYVKNRQVAEDLTQEVFMKCFEKLHTFKGNSSLKTWLYRIAINHTKDYLRSWYAKNILVDDLAVRAQQSSQSVDDHVLLMECDRELVYAVNQLDLKYSEVIHLFYFTELTSREIAQLLKINENTVKTRLRKAKKLLEKQLGDDQND